MNLKDDALLEDPTKLPHMRYLFNDHETFKQAMTLIFSTVHIGNHGANEKDKIRTNLRSILQHFFNLPEEEATCLKREGNKLGD